MSLTFEETWKMTADHLSPSNKSPYGKNPFHGGMLPQTIYLYYVDKIVRGKKPDPRAYVLRYPLPIRNQVQLGRLIQEAAQEAYDGAIESAGSGFDAVDWIYKSFIVILIDYEGWSYNETNAIVFVEDPEQGKVGNHTFFDAFHPRVMINKGGQEKEVAALCFTNWMVDAYGHDLADGQKESFEYVLNPRFGDKDVPTPIDPGGNNLGPPVPPP